MKSQRINSLLISLLVFLLVLTIPIGAQDSTHKMEMKVAPAYPLSNHWIFVVDGSDSMRGVFDKVKRSFSEFKEFQADEVYYAAITFDDPSMERFREWERGSPDTLDEITKWVNVRERNRIPVNSYGIRAIQMALEQSEEELTIILITDGGFTEVCRHNGDFSVISNVIESGQQARVNRGLSQALICSIGIENKHYTAGNKPSDERCQEFMASVGSQWGGGYFLISEK